MHIMRGGGTEGVAVMVDVRTTWNGCGSEIRGAVMRHNGGDFTVTFTSGAASATYHLNADECRALAACLVEQCDAAGAEMAKGEAV